MSKRYTEVEKLVDTDKQYPIEEAIVLAKQTSTVKFDASVDVHLRLNIDPKQTDQKVRVQVTLPHGTGKAIRVAAFVTQAREKEATEAGADIVGGEELIKKLKETEKTDFDIAVAEPAMMKSLTAVAKILGQRGLMPTPKTGTVGPDISKLVREFKGGRVDIRTDDSGNIHQSIGKASFDAEKLVANFHAILDVIKKAKPASVKKEFIGAISISSSMGPGIRVKK